MYSATICRLKNVRKAENSDNLQLANVEGSQVIVGLNSEENTLGIFFPSEGQLSENFCKVNDLVGPKKYFDEKRRVKCIRLRGHLSEGVWFPLSYLSYIDPDLKDLPEGLNLTEYKGHPLCHKYIVLSKNKVTQQKERPPENPLFKKHVDTPYLHKYLNYLTIGDLIILTCKMHGESNRIAKLPVDHNYGWFKRTLSKILNIKIGNFYKVLLGSRTVEVDWDGEKDDADHRRGVNYFVKDKLRSGETVYSEIVGYRSTGKPIMNPISKKKLGDFKTYLNHNGESMHFKYGNEVGQCSQYVYRITQTDENGKRYDLSWNQIKKRCIELELKHVPELLVLIYDGDKDSLMRHAELLSYGRDVVDPSHIREGVVARVENALGVNFFKYKSIDFRLLEDTVAEEVNTEDLA